MGYLQSCRMVAAKKYLAGTSKSIGEIVEICGFSDSSNFSRSFKEQVGCTPSEFRKKYRWLLDDREKHRMTYEYMYDMWTYMILKFTTILTLYAGWKTVSWWTSWKFTTNKYYYAVFGILRWWNSPPSTLWIRMKHLNGGEFDNFSPQLILQTRINRWNGGELQYFLPQTNKQKTAPEGHIPL